MLDQPLILVFYCVILILDNNRNPKFHNSMFESLALKVDLIEYLYFLTETFMAISTWFVKSKFDNTRLLRDNFILLQ